MSELKLRPTKQVEQRQRNSCELPNLAANCSRTHERVSLLAAKCLGKSLHVRRRGNGAQTRERVRVRIEHEPLEFGAVSRRPDLCESEKESLLRREAPDRRGLLASQFFLERTICDVQPAEVRNALSQYQVPVLVQVVLDFVALKLLFHALCSLIEVLFVLGSPPIAHVSLGIKFSAFIVETVCHLMADYGAYSTVIRGVVGVRVEKWRLQDAGGKDDFVHLRVVVGIHSGRSHIPFRSIDGLPDLIQVAFKRKLGSSHLIRCVRNSVYLVGGIFAPFVRVADLAHKRGKFGERLLARRRDRKSVVS